MDEGFVLIKLWKFNYIIYLKDIVWRAVMQGSGSCKEDSDNNNEHHGGVVGIPLPSVSALLAKPKYWHSPEIILN